jgi:hypothetical protein
MKTKTGWLFVGIAEGFCFPKQLFRKIAGIIEEFGFEGEIGIDGNNLLRGSCGSSQT